MSNATRTHSKSEEHDSLTRIDVLRHLLYYRYGHDTVFHVSSTDVRAITHFRNPSVFLALPQPFDLLWSIKRSKIVITAGSSTIRVGVLKKSSVFSPLLSE